MELKEVKAAPIGLAAGGFPVHIISTQPFPEDLFQTTDESFCRLYWGAQSNYFILEILRDNTGVWQGLFSVPLVMLERYLETQQLLHFKKRFLNYIDIPWIISRNRLKVRRLFRLTLDVEWLEALRDRRRRDG